MVTALPTSMVDRARKWWPDLERAIFQELGSTATIFEFGAPRRSGGVLSASTFTTRAASASGLEATVTPTTSLYTLATPLNLSLLSNYQGIVPTVSLNGTSEYMTAPDNNYWTRALVAFSVGVWVKRAAAGAASRLLMGKDDATTGSTQREWLFLEAVSPENVIFYIRDNTAGSRLGRYQNANLVANTWYFLVGTYDGGTGSSGVKVYINGAQADDTSDNAGAFTTMRNTTSVMSIGASIIASGAYGNYSNHTFAGGPLGPFFTQVELTAAQIKNLYFVGMDALGL